MISTLKIPKLGYDLCLMSELSVNGNMPQDQKIYLDKISDNEFGYVCLNPGGELVAGSFNNIDVSEDNLNKAFLNRYDIKNSILKVITERGHVRTLTQQIIEIDYTVDEMKQGVVEFLTKNPEVTISNLAVRMVSSGMDIVYASKITGVSTEEIIKLQNIKY